MKTLGFFAVLAILLLVGCAPDATLNRLIAKNAVTVVLVDHPQDVLTQTAHWGAGLDGFPLETADLARPWAAAVLPAKDFTGEPGEPAIPSFQIFVPLKDPAVNFSKISDFALKTGGLNSILISGYAILYSPGAPLPTLVAEGQGFDLARVRQLGVTGVAVYLDVKNMMDSVVFPEGFQEELKALPWVEREVDGFVGVLDAEHPGFRWIMKTDLKKNSAFRASLAYWKSEAELQPWRGFLSEGALASAALSFPPSSLTRLPWWASLSDPILKNLLRNVLTLVGPRSAVNLFRDANGEWQAGGALEVTDAQAFRQALKALVASGSVQRNLGAWGLDGDLPIIFQDQKGGPWGYYTKLTLGSETIFLAYGDGRVFFGTGAQGLGRLTSLSREGRVADPWRADIPGGSAAVLGVSLHAALSAFEPPEAAATIPKSPATLVSAVQILADGNLQIQTSLDADATAEVQQRLMTELPQVLSNLLVPPSPSP